MPEKRFIGIKELAEYLGINKDTIYSWTFQRKIPYIKMGRCVKFDLRKIKGWIREREVKPFEY